MQTLYHRYIDVNSPLHRPYDSTINNEAPTAKSKKALYVYEECGSDERVVACRRFKDYVRASLARARARFCASGSLTNLNLRYTNIGNATKQLLRDAVRGRQGFQLFL